MNRPPVDRDNPDPPAGGERPAGETPPAARSGADAGARVPATDPDRGSGRTVSPGEAPGGAAGPSPAGAPQPASGAPDTVLRRFRARGKEGGDAPGTFPEAPAERYSMVGEIARGGMGAIVKIVDNDIRRSVAMKVILGGDDSGRLERFVEEAQVTGQLEHPNIVPVHELGVNAEGRVFFTMKLVRGESLQTVIDRIADEGGGRSPGRGEGDPAGRPYGDRYPLSRLLAVFLKVCDAVAFAHSKGVIHRDLKPDNVMVGRFGEVLVMDWGLAKATGRPDCPDGASRQADAPDRRGAGEEAERVWTIRSGPWEGRPEGEKGGSGEGVPRGKGGPGSREGAEDRLLTVEGEVLGTPAYMPPEQAQGRIDAVDERSDVFALGGILYSILTHEAPYEGDTVRDLLRKAVLADVPSARGRAPWNRIPAELESVCAKAMAAEPGERYASAEALAADVQAHLDRRLVSAHRYGPLARFVRLVQRHPAGSLAGGVALLLVAAGTAVAGLLAAELEAEASRAREQSLRAEAQAARAEAESLRAGKAEKRADTAEAMLEKGRRVSALLRAAEQELGPAARAAEAALLAGDADAGARADALRRLARDFERSCPPDSASRAAWLAVRGWIEESLGEREVAMESFRGARDADPEVAQGWLFEALVWLGRYLELEPHSSVVFARETVEFGEDAGETPEMADARQRFESLLAEMRSARVWGASAAADARAVLDGLRAFQEHRLDEADAGISRTLLLPESSWIADTLLLARSRVRLQRGRLDEGISDIERILSGRPRNASARVTLGNLLLARGLSQSGRGEDPSESLGEALGTLDALVRDHPRVPAIWLNRGTARVQRAFVEEDRGGDPVPWLRRGLEDFDETVRLAAGYAPGRRNRGVVRTMLAGRALQAGEDPGELLRAALADFEVILERGEIPSVLVSRGVAFDTAAEAEAREGRDPLPLYEKALRDYDRAIALRPDFPDALVDRAKTRLDLARRLTRAGADAEGGVRTAIADLERALALRPGMIVIRCNLAQAQAALAESLLDKGRDPFGALDAAARSAGEAVEARPGYWPALLARGEALSRQAILLVERGEDSAPLEERAAADLQEVLRQRPGDLAALVDMGNLCLGAASRQVMRGGDGRAEFSEALRFFDRAVERDPASTEALAGRASARAAIASRKILRGEDAGSEIAGALGDYGRILARSPGDLFARNRRAIAWRIQAEALRAGGKDPSEAFAKAMADHDAVLAARPGYAAGRIARGTTLFRRGAAEWAARKDARACLDAAARDFETVRSGAASGGARANLGEVRLYRAWVGAGFGEELGPLLEAALADYDAAGPGMAKVWLLHAQRGQILQGLGRHAEAVRALEAAAGLLPALPHEFDEALRSSREILEAPAWKAHFLNGDLQVEWSNYRAARQFYEEGLRAAAKEGADRRDAGNLEILRHTLFNVACLYSLLSEGRRSPLGPASPVGEAEAKAFRETALARLMRAVECGWEDLEAIRTEPELAAVRAMPEFAAQLRQWEAKAGGGGK